VRRTPGGLLLLVSALLVALAISLFWLQRVAFTPSTDADLATAVMADDGVRSEVATLIASADAPVLNRSSARMREFIVQILQVDAGGALTAPFVEDAHARIIGERDEPVQIAAGQQVAIVRDERVALEPPITLPVQEIGIVAALDTITWWMMVVAAGLGLLALLVGIVLRPEKGEATLALAGGFAALALLFPLFGWLVPVALLPAISDDTWMAIFPALAAQARFVTFAVAIVSLVLAVLVVVTTSSARQRRQFSTPLGVGRYREQQRWNR
jgi:hypothetical protein